MRSDRYSRILVGVVALALAACMDDPTAATGTFSAQLDGASVVPALSPVPTGTGSATCTVEASTFTCTVSWSGLTGAPTAIHVHAANSGATAANNVRVNICGAGTAPACPATSPVTSGSQPAVGTGQTYSTVATAMYNVGTYVNIHTAANAGGEIRGQLLYQP